MFATSGGEKKAATPSGPVPVQSDPSIKADTKEEEDL
jgi:hypothetical protein